jgi:general stress protein YciG
MSDQEQEQKKPRGFAAISPERHREISRLGGLAAHQKGVAHEWGPESARIAGSLGGIATKQKNSQPV